MSENQQNSQWREQPLTGKQQAAINFIASQNPSLKAEATQIKTVGQANAWLSRQWRDAMLEGPKEQYLQLYLPRVYAKTINARTKEGEEFQKIIFTMPRGMRLPDGTDLSGTKLSQSLTRQYIHQLKDKTQLTLTVWLPADKTISLYKVDKDKGIEQHIQVNGRDLVHAMAAHRQAWAQQHEGKRNPSQNKPGETKTRGNARQENQRQQTTQSQALNTRHEQQIQQQQIQQQDKDIKQEQQQEAQVLTPQEQEAETRSERRLMTAAATLGISAAMIQVSGTIKPGYTAYRLAMQGQSGTWTRWHTIRYLADPQELSRSIQYMAAQAHIPIRDTQKEQVPVPLAPDGFAQAISHATKDSNGKIRLTGGAVRQAIEHNSQEARRQADPFPPTMSQARDQALGR